MKWMTIGLILCYLATPAWSASFEDEVKLFLEQHTREVAAINKSLYLAYWQASGTGKAEYYKKVANLELQLSKIYADKQNFAKIKWFSQNKQLTDPLLQRQVQLLYWAFLQNQIDPKLQEKLIRMATAIDEKFNNHRALFQGKAVSDNTLADVLKKETRNEVRKAAWEASKVVGEKVAADLLALIKVRNQAARSLGFADYYQMSLQMAEQSVGEIDQIFAELDRVTRAPFIKVKNLIDRRLAARYKIKVADMRPYHYQDFFFQDVQDIGEVNVDQYLKDKDIKKICENFYNGMGLKVSEILKRSDLYERPGKYQHAYCMALDRKGDVRIMTSLRNNRYWLETLMHELGHGVYSSYLDKKLPWLLREEAHIFTTEAIAQMFEGLPTNPYWLKQAAGLPSMVVDKWAKTLELERKMRLLIFCRWSLVMFYFEKELYRDPGQDLDKLWWDYVEKYQMVKRIAGRDKPDWAAKIHLATTPVYYHNYMLGNLMVSQMVHYMADKILKEKDIAKVTFIGQPQIGQYLKQKIFEPGKAMRWDKLIIAATGEPLTAKYFAEDVIISDDK